MNRQSVTGTVKGALAAWQGFWFAPLSTSTLALVRIAFALVLLAFTVSLGHDLMPFFGSDGLLPKHPEFSSPGARGTWGPLQIFSGDLALIVVYGVLLAAALCLLVGFGTRIAAALAFLGLLAFSRRNPFVFNSGDALLRVISFYLVLAPSGASLSIDRWLKARRRGIEFWEFPRRAAWPLRLIQVQTCILYLATAWAKVRAPAWNDGTALSYAFRIEFLDRFPFPSFMTDSPIVVNLLTYGTLAIELGVALLVWNRRLRPWVLCWGVALHLLIEYRIRVGFFSYGIFVLYLAFIPPETMDRWLLRLRDRLRHRRAKPEAGQEEATQAEPSAFVPT